MRNILLLLIGVIGLAILRNLIREIGRFVSRAMGPSASAAKKAEQRQEERVQSGGKLVRDPNTGTYVDPAHAVRAKVGGTVHYFESEASRDAYLKSQV